MLVNQFQNRRHVSNQLISLASRENSVQPSAFDRRERPANVSNQLISLASREFRYTDGIEYLAEKAVSNQLISLASRELWPSEVRFNPESVSNQLISLASREYRE